MTLILFFAVCLIGFISACLADEAEYAAPDAFINGSGHPYYGSDNPWNRRFFGDIDKDGKLLLRGGDLRLYGRRGQRQMLDTLEGRVKYAVKCCEQLLPAEPNEPESLCSVSANENFAVQDPP